jgi:anti-sigma regulatory factor (Ser/Thr protein kinase)
MEGRDGAAAQTAVGDRLDVAATAEGVGALAGWLEALWRRRPVPEDVGFAVRLCLEEAMTNVVFHAYADGAPAGPLAVTFEDMQDQIRFTVIDAGRPFDPVAAEAGPMAGTIEDVPVGGQGLNLIRSFAAGIGYERRDGQNRLRLTFEAPRG